MIKDWSWNSLGNILRQVNCFQKIFLSIDFNPNSDFNVTLSTDSFSHFHVHLKAFNTFYSSQKEVYFQVSGARLFNAEKPFLKNGIKA